MKKGGGSDLEFNIFSYWIRVASGDGVERWRIINWDVDYNDLGWGWGKTLWVLIDWCCTWCLIAFRVWTWKLKFYFFHHPKILWTFCESPWSIVKLWQICMIKGEKKSLFAEHENPTKWWQISKGNTFQPLRSVGGNKMWVE